ncbi:MAG TPA: type II toxin-antitoxin system HicB family antitoxin [Gemmataceae bacterium]|nr:type II toxin-antitoxin system HicB family antitoxin [Gemmataceae bacterium]
MDDFDEETRTYWFLVVIGRTKTGYDAHVPDLQGCVAVGMTVEHTRHMIAEAVEMHLELMQQSGEKIPEPRQSIEITVDPEAGEEFYTWVDVEVPQPTATT